MEVYTKKVSRPHWNKYGLFKEASLRKGQGEGEVTCSADAWWTQLKP
jgi:hypothetical protein